MSATTPSVATTQSTNAAAGAASLKAEESAKRAAATRPPLSMTTQRSSVTDTALRIDAAAREVIDRHVITLANGKKYLIWATVALPQNPSQRISISAERAAWINLEGAIKATLTGNETGEVTLEVEQGRLKKDGKPLNLPANNSGNEPTATTKVVQAFATFQSTQGFKNSILNPKPYESSKFAASAASASKHVNSSSRSYARDYTDPIKAAISDLERPNTPISGTTLLTCLESLKDQKVKIVSTREPNTSRNTTWETEITGKMRPSGYTDNHLLENCIINPGESVYIPIRITGSSHYVGLFVKGGKTYYYDSKGRPYTYNPHRNGRTTALEQQIKNFCKKNNLAPPDNNSQYIVTENPHQSSEDHVHCGMYQINWYCTSLNATVNSLDAEPIDRDSKMEFTAQRLRQVLTKHLRNELRDSQPSSTQSSPKKPSATTTSSATAAATNSATASTQSKPPRTPSSVTIEDADDSDDDEPSTTPTIAQSTIPTTVNASTATTATTTSQPIPASARTTSTAIPPQPTKRPTAEPDVGTLTITPLKPSTARVDPVSSQPVSTSTLHTLSPLGLDHHAHCTTKKQIQIGDRIFMHSVDRFPGYYCDIHTPRGRESDDSLKRYPPSKPVITKPLPGEMEDNLCEELENHYARLLDQAEKDIAAHPKSVPTDYPIAFFPRLDTVWKIWVVPPTGPFQMTVRRDSDAPTLQLANLPAEQLQRIPTGEEALQAHVNAVDAWLKKHPHSAIKSVRFYVDETSFYGTEGLEAARAIAPKYAASQAAAPVVSTSVASTTGTPVSSPKRSIIIEKAPKNGNRNHYVSPSPAKRNLGTQPFPRLQVNPTTSEISPPKFLDLPSSLLPPSTTASATAAISSFSAIPTFSTNTAPTINSASVSVPRVSTQTASAQSAIPGNGVQTDTPLSPIREKDKIMMGRNIYMDRQIVNGIIGSAYYGSLNNLRSKTSNFRPTLKTNDSSQEISLKEKLKTYYSQQLTSAQSTGKTEYVALFFPAIETKWVINEQTLTCTSTSEEARKAGIAESDLKKIPMLEEVLKAHIDAINEWFKSNPKSTIQVRFILGEFPEHYQHARTYAAAAEIGRHFSASSQPSAPAQATPATSAAAKTSSTTASLAAAKQPNSTLHQETHEQIGHQLG